MKILIQKIYESRFYPVILCLIHFSLLGVVVYLIDYLSKGEICEILKRWIPWNLRINFLFLLSGIIICYRDIVDAFKKCINKKGLSIIALVILAFLATSFIVPRTHRIFYDEDIYANVGENIALTGKTGYCNYGTFEYGEYYPRWITYNKEPSGWPFLISLAFQLFGVNEIYAFLLNNILFSGGVLLVFFIIRYLTGAYLPSFLSALAFAAIPHNMIWSNTAAAEPSSSFFAGAVVLSFLVFLKTGKKRHLFLLVVLIPFACQMRPESILILIWAIIALLALSPGELTDKRLWTFSLLITLFLLPHLLHIYATSGHSWGAGGTKFSSDFFLNNLKVNGMYYLNNQYFPVLLTALGLTGLLFSRLSIRWRLLMLLWFLLFWGIFLFFYAGSYRYGADVRFSLVTFMPIAILAGIGGDFVCRMQDTGCRMHLASGIVILVMLFSFVHFLPLIRRVGQEAWGARYDHKYAHEFIKKIPRRSIVLTHNPTMLLLWKQNAIQTYAGINNPELIEKLMVKYRGHVYFHYNYWCNTKNARNIRLCQAIKEKYMLEEIARGYEQDFEYALYRMSLR